MLKSTLYKNSEPVCEPGDFYFNGLCMSPGESWNPQMELEHWNRYQAFEYLAESRNVLDAACGEGYGTALLARLAATATGIDLSERNITHANAKYGQSRDNLRYAVEDAGNLPDGYGPFDIVYSFETIEHVENIASFLACLTRVMKDDGVAIISTPKPNINPITGRPFNPFHVIELSAAEFESVFREHFGFVQLAGQSSRFPCEIHQGFEESTDAYAVAVVSNNAGAAESIIRRLPEIDTTETREKLFIRQFNRIRNFQKPMRILFVPLVGRACDNPSDRRRIALPAGFLRGFGAEVAIVNKKDVLNINSDVIYSQDRDYGFWLNNIAAVTKNGRRLIFSSSDALGLTRYSRAHNFDAYSGKAGDINAEGANSELKQFLETCCAYVFAGSEAQRRLISDIAPAIASKTGVLADPIDVETYNEHLAGKAKSENTHGFTLIWEGFCDNIPYLSVCANAIRRLAARIPLKVIVVCAAKRRNEFLGTTDNARLVHKLLGDSARFHIWDTATISELMASADAGLAPVFMDCPFSAAKPENKAVIYNYMKLPVIASPTEAYNRYVRNGVNGFIAKTDADWEGCIEYLFSNPQQRHKIGEYGHKIAVENYSVEAIAGQLLQVCLNDEKYKMGKAGML